MKLNQTLQKNMDKIISERIWYIFCFSKTLHDLDKIKAKEKTFVRNLIKSQKCTEQEAKQFFDEQLGEAIKKENGL